MSCFNNVSTATANGNPDLTRHVKYTFGMILGVDDFTQEFAYLAGRDRWLARDALGYGTVSGLTVKLDKDADKRPRVMVFPGVAISPRGQLICVSSEQCAYLNEWLAANAKELDKHLGSATASPPVTSPHLKDELTLYVVLCYRDCEVEKVPIPGEPCRSEEDLMAASRIQDDFSLELRYEAPKQPEEEKIREYVEWLAHIDIVETGDSTPPDDFRKGILAEWLPPTSPPTITSPPSHLQINVEDVSDYMRAAFRIWVTELRNVLSERKTGCSVEMTGGESIEDCVLLAKLHIPLVSISTGWKVSDSEDAAIDEEKRPFLLHLRMLQELMLSNLSRASGTHPPVTSPPQSPQAVSLKDLTDVKITDPKDGNILSFNGTNWVNKKTETGGGVTDHGNLTGLADDEKHENYLLLDGKRALKGNLDAGGFRATNLKPAEKDGEAVVFDQLVKQNEEGKGDISGRFSDLKVTGLQGSKVSPKKPEKNQILIFDGDFWTPNPQPEIPAQPAQKTQLILPFATITRGKEFNYEIWFNIDAPGNAVKVLDFNQPNQPQQLFVLEEIEKGLLFTNSKIEARIIPVPNTRNVFSCTVVPATTPGQPAPVEPERMRFRFDTTLLNVEIARPRTTEPERMTLFEYAEKFNIKFIGSVDGKIVSVFVRRR